MKKSRKVQISAPSVPSLEPLEARQLLSAVDVGITTVLPLLTNDTTPALIGTVGDNTADVWVTIKQGEDVIGIWDALEDGAGGWEFTLPDGDALPDGVYDILVTATANEGEDYGEVSVLAGLTIDATAPAVTVDPLTTNATSPELTGTVDDPEATISVNVNGVDYDAVNNGEGTWTLAAGLIADLEEGTYDVTVTATDTLGNADTDSTVGELVIDLTAPVTATDDLTTNSVSPELTGTVDDPEATISVNVNGVDYDAVNNGDGTWTLAAGQIEPLADGTYDVTVTATDTAGNVGTDVTTDELVVDAPPTVTINTLVTNVASPELTGTVDDPEATIIVTVNGVDYDAVNNGDGTWTLAAGQIADLAEGTYDVTVTATDTTDNVGTDASADELVIDFTPPVATVDELTTNATSPELTGTVDDPEATISVNVNGVDYDAVNNGDGTWTLAAGQIADLADGTYDVTVTASDAAGNVGTDATIGELTIDATAPTVTINTVVTNAVSPELTGTVDDPDATITVTVNGIDYDAVNNGDGTWTLAAGQIADLEEGTYDVTVVATDALGNAGTDASTDELVVDLTAPVVAANDVTTNVASPELNGTVDDADATVIVAVDGVDYAAVNNGDGTWTLAAGQIADLAEGTYDVTVTATDTAGNEGVGAAMLTIDLTAPTASTATTITANSSPALAGAVDDPMATVTVTVRGSTYAAINNGDGTWTLPEGTIAGLPNGLYKLTITVTDAAGNETADSASYLLVDNTGPLVTVDKTLTTDTTPALGGTVNDNTAEIMVIVDGAAYDAVNNGDGTWTLPDNTVAQLGQGVHTVTVVATDALGNVGTANSTLSIASTVSVNLGAGVSSVTYFDADGTAVTLTAGKGNLNVSFTGVNVTITGTGKTRTVTANGGVMNVAVDVVADSKSLAVKTGKGGDGLATINSITGAGILASLKGSNLMIAGQGIDMLGRIQSINVYGIAADVVMNAATLPTKGVAITVGVLRDCTIQTAYIKSLSVVSGSKNANVSATAITTLAVKGGFENSNITANSIGSATLYNVAADNGDVPFGLTTESLKKLTLKQGKTTLVWGKDFIGGIMDLFVNTGV